MEAILNAIDNISKETFNTEFAVECALCDSYEKAVMIIEESSSTDISAFAIFQEGGIMDEVKKKEKKDGSKVKSILLFIPRLIAAMFNALMKKIGKTPPVDKVKEMATTISEYKITKEEKKSTFKKITSHPAVKTLGIASTAIAGKATYDMIKNAVKQIKDIKQFPADVEQANRASAEFFKNFNPVEYMVFYPNESGENLCVALPENIKGFGSQLLINYYAEIHGCIMKCKSAISKAKTINDVTDHLSKCAVDIAQLQTLETAWIPTNTENVGLKEYKPDELYDALYKLQKFIANQWRLRERITADFDAIAEAIPTETITKGVLGKASYTAMEKTVKKADEAAGVDSSTAGTIEARQVETFFKQVLDIIQERVYGFHGVIEKMENAIAECQTAYIEELEKVKNGTSDDTTKDDAAEDNNAKNDDTTEKDEKETSSDEKVYSGKEVIKLLKERDPASYGNAALDVNEEGKVYNSKRNSPPKSSYNYKKDENGKSRFVWNDEKNGYVLEYFTGDFEDDEFIF